MIIECATIADLDEIQEIEGHSFKVPWPRATFEAELSRDFARIEVARDLSNGAGERRGVVVGFCNYWLVAPGHGAGGEVHILAIATRPDRRRAGIGARLLAHALDAGSALGATLAPLEVRKGNKPAIALYERAGFHTVHVRTRYYQDDGEDALVMLAELNTPVAAGARITAAPR